MTIAITLKIGDGIILGADSAVTIGNPLSGRANYYYNAEKVINLVKGLPLGAVTYGLAGFDGRSSTRLAKDLRRRLSDSHHEDWVNPDNYTMEEVAGKVKDFFFGYYAKDFPEGGDGTHFGFMVAGYAPDAAHGEIWHFQVDQLGQCSEVVEIIPGGIGIFYNGQGDALNRLLRGWSTETVNRLTSDQFPAAEVVKTLDSVAPLWHAAMPIQDGIDLVRYLVQVTSGFVRFIAEPTTVAPPIDLAAITLHEGFRWVERKHYYRPELNRPASVHERAHPTTTAEDDDV